MPTPLDQRERQRLRAAARYKAHPDRWAARYQANRERVLVEHHEDGIPCRGCRVPRYVSAGRREQAISEGGPLCRKCRRADRERLKTLEAQFRAMRTAAAQPVVEPRPARKGSGRSGTGSSRYRRNRLFVLADSDVCGICGHGGSMTADHIVPHRKWPRGADGTLLPGFNEIDNLQPAHGTLGKTGLVNRCAECDRLCNQSKGSR